MNDMNLGFLDLIDGIKKWRIWFLLGWQDIKMRYRRSFLGPFWITISMAVMIYTMGFLYAKLFKIELNNYFPFLAAGILIWNFLSTSILEMTNAFIESTGFIRQIKLPFTVYILRALTRNIIVFLHNALAILPILIYYRVHFLPLHFLMSFLVCGFWIFSFGMLFAMLGARYRDIRPIMTSIIQLVIFVTPIMWRPEMIPEKYSFAITYNPFYHLIEIMRAPLIGLSPPIVSLTFTMISTASASIAMLILFFRFRRYIPFWV